MSDLADRIKAKMTGNRSAAAAAAFTPPVVPVVPPEPVMAAVKALCGHDVPFKPLPEGQEDPRLKRMASRPCKSCRSKEAARQQAMPKKKPVAPSERLPDRSYFSVSYNAAEEHWTGTLSIPGCPMFQGRKSGVFTLLRFLDQCYRQHLQKNQVDVPKEGG